MKQMIFSSMWYLTYTYILQKHKVWSLVMIVPIGTYLGVVMVSDDILLCLCCQSQMFVYVWALAMAIITRQKGTAEKQFFYFVVPIYQYFGLNDIIIMKIQIKKYYKYLYIFCLLRLLCHRRWLTVTLSSSTSYLINPNWISSDLTRFPFSHLSSSDRLQRQPNQTALNPKQFHSRRLQYINYGFSDNTSHTLSLTRV